MTHAELARGLRALGCELKRQANGSHEIWHCARTNRSPTVPLHSGDLPTGTLHAVLRGLGLTRPDLDRVSSASRESASVSLARTWKLTRQLRDRGRGRTRAR